MSDPLHLPVRDVVALVRRVFRRHGCSERVADILAGNCVGAERDGSTSHGLFRIRGYVDTLRSGWADGKAMPDITDVAAGFLRVDGCNGFAQPALEAVAPLLLDKAGTAGIAICTIFNSHHFAALAPDVEPFADKGYLALAFVNSNREVAPSGGHRAVYGTNPMAFAAPRRDGPPIVFDQASAVVANGEVRIAAAAGHKLAPGTGIDRRGNPTDDPALILDGGALLPFGGYKGGALAMMVEILCAALGGGHFSFEVEKERAAFPGAQTARTGETVIVIDPRKNGLGAAFTDRIETLVAEARAAGQERLPGDRRYAARQRAIERGIPVSQAMLDTLRSLVGEVAD